MARLHGSYHVDDPSVAARLDDALREVADDGLEQVLLGRSLVAAHAVCIGDIRVEVRLDPERPVRDLADAWSAAIVRAVEHRLEDGEDVVVYRRELDLLVDLARSMAAGDRSRAWAWRQAGVLDPRVTWPRSDDLARALVARAELGPAVAGAAGPALRSVLDPNGWLALAAALAPILGGGDLTTSAVPGVQGSVGDEHGGDVQGGDEVRVAERGEGVARAARSVVPEPAWISAGVGTVGRALAALALACVEPSRCRDPRAIAAVLSASPVARPRVEHGAEPAPAPSTPPGAPVHRPGGPTHPVGAGADAAEPAADRSRVDALAAPAPSDPSTAADRVVTAHGGVLFLVHAISALDLVSDLDGGPLGGEPPRESLARIVSSATGVAPSDPAVLAVAGWRGEPLLAPLAPLDVEGRAAIDDAAGRLRSWVLHRLDDDGDPPDLGWIWTRPATIDDAPGSIEAEYRLDDVDVRLRLAGLDLDPGYVWWLGSVVRFRYA